MASTSNLNTSVVAPPKQKVAYFYDGQSNLALTVLGGAHS